MRFPPDTGRRWPSHSQRECARRSHASAPTSTVVSASIRYALLPGARNAATLGANVNCHLLVTPVSRHPNPAPGNLKTMSLA